MATLFLLLALHSGHIDGATVVERSIRHHDPQGVWAGIVQTFPLRESRPDGSARHLRITIDHPGERFVYEGRVDGVEIHKQLDGEDCAARVDGSADLSPELAAKYRTSCDEIRRFRDYYDYLLGMPMKLEDPGTIIDPAVRNTIFGGQRVIEVKVTYSPEVGTDVWYYYFDPRSFALRGARFYHDEEQADGEMIVFEDEIAIGDLVLPRHRRWYRNRDEHYLGTDTLLDPKPTAESPATHPGDHRE